MWAISPRQPASLLELPQGVWHIAAEGDCTWAEFAEAIFEEAGASCRVRRITTSEFHATRNGRPTPYFEASAALRRSRIGERACGSV